MHSLDPHSLIPGDIHLILRWWYFSVASGLTHSCWPFSNYHSKLSIYYLHSFIAMIWAIHSMMPTINRYRLFIHSLSFIDLSDLILTWLIRWLRGDHSVHRWFSLPFVAVTGIVPASLWESASRWTLGISLVLVKRLGLFWNFFLGMETLRVQTLWITSHLLPLTATLAARFNMHSDFCVSPILWNYRL